VGVFGYGGGVIGRYCDQPDAFPGVAHFHTMRVNQPGGKFYTTEYLKKLCDLWDFRGSGITNMHGSTGDIIFLGTTTPQLEEIFYELTHKFNQDLGGSGSNLRTPADCIGQARCECLLRHPGALLHPDPGIPGRTPPSGLPLQIQVQVRRLPQLLRGLHRPFRPVFHRHLERRHQNRPGSGAGLHRRRIPPNAGSHNGRDWGPFDIQKEVIDLCPTDCMWMERQKLKIDDKECTRCMHCINVMPRALRIGDDRGCPSSGRRQGPHPRRCPDGLPAGSLHQGGRPL
jgi:sulfite reductase alpha subunit